MAEAGDVLAFLTRTTYGVEGQGIPPVVVGGKVAVVLVEYAVQVLTAVLGHTEEPRPASEQSGGECALERVGCRQEGEARRDRSRSEAVVGQRDEHRLEDADLLPRRTSQRDQPERELAEADVAHQVLGEVLPEEPDLVLGRRPQRRREAQLAHHPSPRSHARISSPCSSRAGGGSR
jgi:hypothetical protein